MRRGRLASVVGQVLLFSACSDRAAIVEEGTVSTGSTGGTFTSTATTTTASTSTSTGSESGSGETEDGGYEGDGGGTGCAFTCPNPNPNPGFGCNFFLSNCPEGEKCGAWANDGGYVPNSTWCVPVAPVPDLVGEPCEYEGSMFSGVDTCEPGASCWGPYGEPELARCRRICGTDPQSPVCPDGTFCLSIGALPLCLGGCDPLAPDACGAGEACQPANGGFACVPTVVLGIRGDPCEFAFYCSAGTTCVPTEDLPGCNDAEPGCCADLCEVGPPQDCPEAGDTCIPIPEAPPLPSHEGVGVCAF